MFVYTITSTHTKRKFYVLVSVETNIGQDGRVVK